MATTEDNSKNCLRTAQVFVVDTALTLAGLAALTGGVYSVFFKDSPAITVTCIGGGLILLFAATIHRFEVLKGFGIEAKVKKLDATIDKAEIALKQLKDLTEITTKSVLMLSSKAGRWSGAPSVDEARELAMNAKRALESVGSSSETIRQALLPWVRVEIGDLARISLEPCDKELEIIADRINNQISEIKPPIPADKADEISRLHKRLNAVRSHVRAGLKDLYIWPVIEVSQHLQSIVDNAPEVTDEAKLSLKRDLHPFCDEIEYLANNFDFKDINFWRTRLRTEQ